MLLRRVEEVVSFFPSREEAGTLSGGLLGPQAGGLETSQHHQLEYAGQLLKVVSGGFLTLSGHRLS